jgi:hypothetical protein
MNDAGLALAIETVSNTEHDGEYLDTKAVLRTEVRSDNAKHVIDI